jgi:hypothetical protein
MFNESFADSIETVFSVFSNLLSVSGQMRVGFTEPRQAAVSESTDNSHQRVEVVQFSQPLQRTRIARCHYPRKQYKKERSKAGMKNTCCAYKLRSVSTAIHEALPLQNISFALV